jgi:hypothetical protein
LVVVGGHQMPYVSMVASLERLPCFLSLGILDHVAFDIFGYPVDVDSAPVASENECNVCCIGHIGRTAKGNKYQRARSGKKRRDLGIENSVVETQHVHGPFLDLRSQKLGC